MAQLLVGSILRLIMKPPKKRPQSMRSPASTDVELGGAGGTAVAVSPDGLTPEEEAYEAKKQRIIKIAWIVGGLLIVCWLLEIPLLPMLKNAAKWAEKSLKHADKQGAGGGVDGEGTTGATSGDSSSADILST